MLDLLTVRLQSCSVNSGLLTVYMSLNKQDKEISGVYTINVLEKLQVKSFKTKKCLCVPVKLSMMDCKNSVFLLSVLVIISCFQSVHSLRCYQCLSKQPNETCATPIDVNKIPSIRCENRTYALGNTFNADYDPQLIRQFTEAANNNTQHECITYEKFYFHENKTETIRGCIPKVDYCRVLQFDPGFGKTFNLTKCKICETDNCNSSTSLRFSGFIMISTLLWYVISKFM
ncbi:hypothetical protein ILUMI_00603 [Ignelater luminosus]|uniref:Protein quiver n=1 Tax=Ignelater luminosus TaxID=2038154 RepID=A0A8K0DSB7_IGNLU|nr:hypothetical protein ILUMI_00603 [Ignelater luminosus]